MESAAGAESQGRRCATRGCCHLGPSAASIPPENWRPRAASAASAEPGVHGLRKGAWKPGGHQAHHSGPLRKGGRWEKHHLHGAGPGPAPCRQEALIKQFVSDVAWGELDYLVVDTPPGTSDEHMAAIEALRTYQPLGALVVTTPQAVSVGDVRRELTFCRKTGLRVMGVVENMSGFTCPHCTECTSVFSRGGGEELARLAGVPFLGSVPLDPELMRSLEEGHDFIREFPGSPTFTALISIAQKILDATPACLP
ncbi:cytosolic Fe-S cluster assembly factor NUBP2 isoform X2 [Trachypithecus francoisi]|uniref:cytosolic Fe-S cluster assembly factor NUBP2 isoform X2 n=1 Tax=Trachypithecus francoisi TaxID=54180 RepID=UPI00141B6E76|nr:cytosolic Fe-S cluster assembly factor NUBP2 isoform X2 [Trachypithecus francoisi]XP_033092118.1 cytosolic Fe-S cluster assembly factor NUBP2 isoform X2 [Trachypithecus francoisi]